MEFYRGLLSYGSKMKTWDTALWAYSQATPAKISISRYQHSKSESDLGSYGLSLTRMALVNEKVTYYKTIGYIECAHSKKPCSSQYKDVDRSLNSQVEYKCRQNNGIMNKIYTWQQIYDYN